jgi:hypothetical protein
VRFSCKSSWKHSSRQVTHAVMPTLDYSQPILLKYESGKLMWSLVGKNNPSKKLYMKYCRGQPRGSPKKPGESCLKPAKNAKPKPNLGPNAKHTLNAIHAVAGPAAHRSGLAKRPLERGLPRSRAHAPSSRVRLARGSPPPSSRVRLTRWSLASAPAPTRV